MATSPEAVRNLTIDLLRHIAEEYSDATLPEIVSAVFTLAKSMTAVVLDNTNDAHNRAQILRCCGEIEAEVWSREPKEQIN